MPDINNIQPNSRVRVGDATVGHITKIELQGWHALVTMRLDGDVHLPANSTAKIGLTSILGSQHIELSAPTDAPAQGRFQSFAAYLAELRDTPSSVNVAAMVGHSTLRSATMDDLDRPATPAQISAMRAHVEEALAAGAIGMSTGTFYPTAAKATMEEIVEVGRPLSTCGALHPASGE